MGTVEALHTAARRFCIDQFDSWVAKYSSFPGGGPYSPEAYRIFPRYRLAQDTLINIERLVFDVSASVAQVKEVLLKAGSSAFESLAGEFKNQPPALLALQNQLSVYSGFIKQLDANIIHRVEPLPFRRVLSSEEVAALWLDLLGKWGIPPTTFERVLNECIGLLATLENAPGGLLPTSRHHGSNLGILVIRWSVAELY